MDFHKIVGIYGVSVNNKDIGVINANNYHFYCANFINNRINSRLRVVKFG